MTDTKEAGRKGGKAAWRGMSKKARSEEMKRRAIKRQITKATKPWHTPCEDCAYENMEPGHVCVCGCHKK